MGVRARGLAFFFFIKPNILMEPLILLHFTQPIFWNLG